MSRDRQQCGEKWGEGGQRQQRKATEGPTRSSGELSQTEGDQPFLLLPSRAFGQLSNQVTSLSRVASGQLFSSLCRPLPPLLPVPPPAAVAADVVFFLLFFSMGFCLLSLAGLWLSVNASANVTGARLKCSRENSCASMTGMFHQTRRLRIQLHTFLFIIFCLS